MGLAVKFIGRIDEAQLEELAAYFCQQFTSTEGPAETIFREENFFIMSIESPTWPSTLVTAAFRKWCIEAGIWPSGYRSLRMPRPGPMKIESFVYYLRSRM